MISYHNIYCFANIVKAYPCQRWKWDVCLTLTFQYWMKFIKYNCWSFSQIVVDHIAIPNAYQKIMLKKANSIPDEIDQIFVDQNAIPDAKSEPGILHLHQSSRGILIQRKLKKRLCLSKLSSPIEVHWLLFAFGYG